MNIPLTASAIFILSLLLVGCNSDQYSELPEPSGQWVPAIPPAPPPVPLNPALGASR